MTGQLMVQSARERKVVKWDTIQNSGGLLDPCHAVAEFDARMRDGYFAFAETVTEKGTEREQIHRGGFDPETQKQVVMTPAIAGGRR
jgi:hypothetical protein